MAFFDRMSVGYGSSVDLDFGLDLDLYGHAADDNGVGYQYGCAPGTPHAAPATVYTLPPEILLHIFAHLPARALCTTASVDKYFHDLSGAGFLWRDLYKANFFPMKVPAQPAPLCGEQKAGAGAATLFSDFDEVTRKWITKDAEWKTYFRERLASINSLRFDASRIGPDCSVCEDGCLLSLQRDQTEGQSIALANVALTPGHLYFWEMSVDQGFAGIMLGVASPSVSLSTQLGADGGSWAFTGDNGGWSFHNGRWINFPDFAPGDRVGVRLYFKSETECEMACYKNGRFLGIPFSGEGTSFTVPLVPAVCLWKAGDRVRLYPDSFVVERIA